MQAAASAKLSRAALRGIVVIAGMVRAALDERHLPAAEEEVVADLCLDPKGWVVVSIPKMPYAYLRAPVATSGVSVSTVDLRRIQQGTPRPPGFNPDAWRQLYAAAKQYRDNHPAERST